jgi:uncharacterized protein DUF4328
MQPAPAPPFTPADRRAQWVKALLRATLILTSLAIVSSLLQIELLRRAVHHPISHAEAVANDWRQMVLRVVMTLLELGLAAAFLAWFHRVHRNLPALGARDLKYTPRWAVGGFFVPFLNLIRPVQVMREVWHASDPAAIERDALPLGPALRNQLGTPPLVAWWWTLWIGSKIAGEILGLQAQLRDRSLTALQTITWLLVLIDVISLASALVAIQLVERITAWQTERWGALPQLPSPSPITPP